VAVFAVTMVWGPSRDPLRNRREQRAWDEHAAFMDRLVDEGCMILGGPIGDGENTMHAIEAADEDEIRARLAGDPWAAMDILRIGEIRPWTIWLDGRKK
jgi:uncharacterized protein YciI